MVFEYKAGDRVICIDTSQRKELTLHAEYIVEEIQLSLYTSETSFIVLVDLGRLVFAKNRFLPANLSTLEKVIYGIS